MSQSPDGPFTQVKTTKSTSLTVKNLVSGTAYYFKVTAYSTLSGTRSYSELSAAAFAMPLQTPSIRSAVQDGPASVQVAWSAAAGAEGFLRKAGLLHRYGYGFFVFGALTGQKAQSLPRDSVILKVLVITRVQKHIKLWDISVLFCMGGT
ncbi:hypothetical protein SDC9_162108 [bioreactor metagenome]|uniref:Fibronectin type-III domain-containing protein n=1 Tax=bioreactor metagenome TaxID=1076179 RepID=A0A645FN67_9ZZZZ